MARHPFDTGVKVTEAFVTPGDDAAHYHYMTTCLKRVGWNEVPFYTELDVALGDTAEIQENAIVDAVNAVAGDL